MAFRNTNKKPKTVSDPERVKKVMDFLDAAFKDYIAARVLLLDDLLPQAAVLASTAIEKYLKALLAFRGNESHGHLKAAQFNALKNFDPEFAKQLNPQFLELLQKCYKLRYPDDLPTGFNLLIADREFLAELDLTALTLHHSFNLKRDQQPLPTAFTQAKQNGDRRLLDDNFILNEIDKQEFIGAAAQRCYAVRNRGAAGSLEALFTITPRPSDGQFMRPALVPQHGKPDAYYCGFESVVDPNKQDQEKAKNPPNRP
jgi:HEPN domain-containing protein